MNKKAEYCSSCGLCNNYEPDDLTKICPRIKPVKRNKKLSGHYASLILTKGKCEGSYSGSVISVLTAASDSGLIGGVLGVGREK
ncbi:MAG: hypothetical protein NTZ73_02590 [Candidatus Diapherotrites archaeon]|nr:hypothetical protein [Candidatus Diapherotrites archaeon]